MACRALLLLALAPACTLYFDGDDPEPEPDPASTPEGPPDSIGSTEKRVFVTTAMFRGGGLGGLEGADEKCNQHARRGNLTGTYRAWLSDANTSAEARMAKSERDYQLVSGEVVAHGWDDLVDGELLHAIDRTEMGLKHSAPPTCMAIEATWTGTNGDGSRAFSNAWDNFCGNWTNTGSSGLLGNIAQAGTNWSHSGCTMPCTSNAALYCVEQ